MYKVLLKLPWYLSLRSHQTRLYWFGFISPAMTPQRHFSNAKLNGKIGILTNACRRRFTISRSRKYQVKKNFRPINKFQNLNTCVVSVAVWIQKSQSETMLCRHCRINNSVPNGFVKCRAGSRLNVNHRYNNRYSRIFYLSDEWVNSHEREMADGYKPKSNINGPFRDEGCKNHLR
jgi:hypothetical protein